MPASLLVAIATAGSAGTLCRHLLAELVRCWCGRFPLHALVVNVTDRPGRDVVGHNLGGPIAVD